MTSHYFHVGRILHFCSTRGNDKVIYPIGNESDHGESIAMIPFFKGEL
jgi:hypothetical protein